METCTKGKTDKLIPLTCIAKGIRERYILVEWPEIQEYMDHPRWSECIFCIEIPGHPCPDVAYMVPETLYNEINYNYGMGN